MTLLAGIIAASWQAPGGGGAEVRFGRETGGSDTFPCSDDRALATAFPLASSVASLSAIVGLFASSSTAGSTARGFIAANASGTPGTILAISSIVTVPAGGGWVTFPISHGALAAGTYFLGIVTASFQGVWQHQTGAGVTMHMANGTFSIASPPGTWPGTTTSYGSQLCVYAIGSS